MKGWVYIITTKSMSDLVKIGFSTKDPQARAAELNHTGNPHPYRVEYDVLVDDPRKIEQAIHEILKKKNLHENKEWFKCSTQFAIQEIRNAVGSQIIVENLYEQTNFDSTAGTRRPKKGRTNQPRSKKSKFAQSAPKATKEKPSEENIASENTKFETFEADKLKAKRLELEAEMLKSAEIKAKRLEAEKLETKRWELESEMLKSEQMKAKRLEAEKLEAKRLELEAEMLKSEQIRVERLKNKELEEKRLELEAEMLRSDQIRAKKESKKM
jgi:hypothetical protein